MTLRDTVLALLVPILWGVAFTMAKPTIGHFPPLFIMSIAYAITFLMMVAIWRTQSQTSHRAGALIASCAATIQGALIFYGYKNLSASVTTLVLQTQVPFAVFFGWLLLGERLTVQKILGIVLALSGVMVIVGLPKETPPILPVLMVIAGAAIWALGQVFAHKFGRDRGPGLLRVVSLHAAAQYLVASLLFEHNQINSLLTATPFVYASLAGFIFLGSLCGNSVWYTVLQRNPVKDVAPFTLLMPAVGVITAWVLLGERLTLANSIGGLIIVLGVAIVTEVRLDTLWQSLGIMRQRGSLH